MASTLFCAIRSDPAVEEGLCAPDLSPQGRLDRDQRLKTAICALEQFSDLRLNLVAKG